MASVTNPVPVEHQIWKDMDPRFPNRLLEVVYVEYDRFVKFKVRSSGKIVQISWKRILKHSAKRGYTFVAMPASAVNAGRPLAAEALPVGGTAGVVTDEISKVQAAAPSPEDGKR